MRKVVSTKEGYSFFIDEESCITYTTGKHMGISDLANKLNISRPSIYSYLQNSINKLYLAMKEKNIPSLDIFSSMIVAFNIHSDYDYCDLYKILPKRMKEEIYEEVK